MKEYPISSTNDVKQFLIDINKVYSLNWYLDEGFHFYNKDGGNFLKKELIEHLNNTLIKSFQFCHDNDLDVFKIVSLVQMELLKSRRKRSANNVFAPE